LLDALPNSDLLLLSLCLACSCLLLLRTRNEPSLVFIQLHTLAESESRPPSFFQPLPHTSEKRRVWTSRGTHPARKGSTLNLQFSTLNCFRLWRDRSGTSRRRSGFYLEERSAISSMASPDMFGTSRRRFVSTRPSGFLRGSAPAFCPFWSVRRSTAPRPCRCCSPTHACS